MAATKTRKKGGRAGAGNGPSKSDAIRDAWIQLGLESRPVDIQNYLADNGVQAASGHIVNIRAKLEERGMATEPENGSMIPDEPETTSWSHTELSSSQRELSVADLLEIKKFVDRLGGLERLEQGLTLLQSFRAR